jgi:two-component system, OmpR family, phosphate regulon sensor histidine kinase PhoR
MVDIRKLELSISKISRIAERTFEVRFDLEKSKFDFTEGQYVSVTLPALMFPDDRGEMREFSLVSSAGEGELVIAFRNTGSGFKKTLLNMPKGSKVSVQGPYGFFVLPKRLGKKYLFIAGGIGITPFISMLKGLSKKKKFPEVTLLTFDKNEKRNPYSAFLKDLGKNDNFDYFPYFGGLKIKDLKVHVSSRDLYYVAGPPDMVSAIVAKLERLGVDRKKIKLEEFTGYKGIIESSLPRVKSKSSVLKKARPVRYKKIMERPMADLEALLEALGKSSLVSETDVHGNITYANDKFVEISKYSREDLIGQNHRILKSGFHSHSFYKNLWATITRGKIWRGEIKNRAKDGSFYWVDTVIAPILNSKGEPIKYISVRFPITEKKEAEEKLRTKARRQEVVTQLSQIAFDDINLSDLYRKTVNLIPHTLKVRYCFIVKHTPNEKYLKVVAGRGWKRFVVGRTYIGSKPRQSMAAYAMSMNTPTVSSDLTIESRFGVSNLLFDHNVVSGLCVVIPGVLKPYGVVGVFSKNKREFNQDDINFVQSVANLLASAERISEEKRKDEFIALASHELKTPVTSVKMFAQIMLKRFEKEKDEQSKLLLQKMNSQLDKLNKLIKDLLDVSKVRAGKLEYDMSSFEIGEVIKETVEELNGQSDEHSIILDEDTNEFVWGDSDRIKQVLNNLLSNAIKYSPGADRIEVGVSTYREKVIVSVHDFGIGIPWTDRERIFDRFFQAKDAKSHTYPGLGLGLYISREIVKRHGGEIWVESAPDKGSTFYFTLPRKQV